VYTCNRRRAKKLIPDNLFEGYSSVGRFGIATGASLTFSASTGRRAVRSAACVGENRLAEAVRLQHWDSGSRTFSAQKIPWCPFLSRLLD
jgi:hypothetical protein